MSRPEGRRWELWGLAAAVVCLFGVYLSPYVLRGFTLPLGLDAPVYVWSARHGGAAGLWAPELIARPAVFGLIEALTRASGWSHAVIVASLTSVAVVVTSLATTAVAWTIARRSSPMLATVVVLIVGAFLTRTALYLSATICLGLIAAALWGVLRWWEGPSWPRAVAPVVFLVLAGLMNPAYFALGLGVILAGALATILMRPEGEGAGRRPQYILVGGIVIAATTAFLLWARAGSPLDTSVDAARRRLIGWDSLVEPFRAQLPGYIGRFLLWACLAVLAGVSVRLIARQAGRARFTWTVFAAWVAGAGVAVVALLAGLPVPAHRVLWSVLPLAIVTGLGACDAVAHVRTDPRRASWPTTMPAWALAAAPVVVALGLVAAQWLDLRHVGSPASKEEIRAIEAIVTRHAATEPGTSLILVADDQPIEMIAHLNWLRATVPADRVLEVVGYRGGYEDFVAGRPPSHASADDLERAFDEDARSRIATALEGPHIAISAAALDETVADAAAGDPSSTEIEPDVFVLADASGGERGGRSEPAALTFSPALPFLVAPVLLLGLALAGWGWTAWMQPGTFIERLLVTPVVGLAAIALAAVAADAVGWRLGAGGGVTAVVVALIASAGVWLASVGGRRRQT